MLEVIKRGAWDQAGIWTVVDNLADVSVGDTVRDTKRGVIWGVVGKATEGGGLKVYGLPAQVVASEKIKP